MNDSKKKSSSKIVKKSSKKKGEGENTGSRNKKYSAYSKEVERLISYGHELFEAISGKDSERCFRLDYQTWYTECHQMVSQLTPNRLTDFEFYYKDEKAKSLSYCTYRLRDYLHGTIVTRGRQKVFDDEAAAMQCFTQQLMIVNAIRDRLISIIYDIKEVLQADLFDSEIESARELNKKGFNRGAGAIAGVILEKHLKDVCLNHKVKISKKRPTISELNDLLKSNDIYNVKEWRLIQYLGDIRNNCDHYKDLEPSSEDVEELINGVDKIIKTIF